MSRPFLIDTDGGSDDIVALIMALRHPDVDVLAFTTVFGNVTVQQATQNTLRVVEMCGEDTPVYAGAAAPLIRPRGDAASFHGEDGIGDLSLPPINRKAESTHAVQTIIDIARRTPDLTLVTLGPLTNIALAVAQAPDIVRNIRACVVMGGAACTYGNTNPAAEFNIWCDPEAAQMVFHSGLPVQMVGWEFCIGEYALDAGDIQRLRDLHDPLADFIIDANRTAIDAYYKQMSAHGISLPDAVTLAIAIDPTIATDVTPHFVQIETQSELTRGMTVVDRLNVAGDEYNITHWAHVIEKGHKTRVTWDVDAARWKALFFDIMAGEIASG